MSELAKRTISGVVMIALALCILWLGGWAFLIFGVLIGFGVVIEWYGLARRFAGNALALWMLVAVIYIGGAVASLVLLRVNYGLGITAAVLASVWAADIGAYAVGRTVGGPKLAPRLSPAKTWSGLGGAMAGAAILLIAFVTLKGWPVAGRAAIAGIVIGALAQAGDLFESWMKRRAGVKDSGRLIPGHGGLFDRLDGLLPVALVLGILVFVLR